MTAWPVVRLAGEDEPAFDLDGTIAYDAALWGKGSRSVGARTGRRSG